MPLPALLRSWEVNLIPVPGNCPASASEDNMTTPNIKTSNAKYFFMHLSSILFWAHKRWTALPFSTPPHLERPGTWQTNYWLICVQAICRDPPAVGRQQPKA
jgi:hypothetical protein